MKKTFTRVIPVLRAGLKAGTVPITWLCSFVRIDTPADLAGYWRNPTEVVRLETSQRSPSRARPGREEVLS